MINIEEHIGLVHFIVHKYFTQRAAAKDYDLDDLFQAGCVGLVKAAKNYDSKFNVKFSTYAVPKILGEIRVYFREDKWFIGNREERNSGKATEPISLFTKITGTEGLCVMDSIVADSFADEIETTLCIEQLLENLDSFERKVIEKLFLEDKVQTDVAKELKTSQRKISKTKIRALEKLKACV